MGIINSKNFGRCLKVILFPFICLAVGVSIGLSKVSHQIKNYIDAILNIGLVILMLTLGAKIGSNDILVSSLGLLGIRCLVIAIFAITGSVLFTILFEKSLLPLHEVRIKLAQEQISAAQEMSTEQTKEEKSSYLVWIMPSCLIVGMAGGFWVLQTKTAYITEFANILDQSLTFSLVILYIGVGTSFGVNKWVFQYLKLLSWRIFLVSAAVLLGSLAGGGLAGILLNMPIYISVGAAAGMSYYSMTGAMLTQAYGIEAGAYGFLVNVTREFLTVLLLPFLVQISLGSPIASGAAGNMDTMLVPITRFVGVELGIVTLITGTILTLLVPILLSLLIYII